MAEKAITVKDNRSHIDEACIPEIAGGPVIALPVSLAVCKGAVRNIKSRLELIWWQKGLRLVQETLVSDVQLESTLLER